MVDELRLPDWMDKHRAAEIAYLRGLGYSQAQIAAEVGVSQQTVSRYLAGIQEAADESDDPKGFFIALVAIALGVALAAYFMRDRR